MNQFGRYKLIRRISLGGMAEVFKAKCYDPVGFEKVVALKRLLPFGDKDEQFIAMFLQEARLAAQLDHQNICRVLELGKVHADYYITMEFIYGHDLRQAFKAAKRANHTIDPWMVAWIGAEIAQGLAYAYNAQSPSGEPLKIVHRDISPQNVMIGFDGTIKVIDFGIAKAAVSTVKTAAGVLKGKYAYMSPEHAGRRTLDARSDIWSLGVVLYELLSGKRLFVGDAVADIIDQVLHRPVDPLLDVPQPLAEVVHRMLQRNRKLRIPTHDEVLEQLNNVLEEAPEPVTARSVAQWMDSLFPADHRLEQDLTDADVNFLLSAEESGDTTTDQRSDISSATQIFLADETGHTDYVKVLERMIAEGRVSTEHTDAEISADSSPSSQPHMSQNQAAWGQSITTLTALFWSAVGLIALTMFLTTVLSL